MPHIAASIDVACRSIGAGPDRLTCRIQPGKLTRSEGDLLFATGVGSRDLCMTVARLMVELSTMVLLSWALVYRLVIAAGLPYRWLGPIALLLSAAVLLVALRRRVAPVRWTGAERRFVIAALALTMAVVGFVSMTSRPDADDAGYLYDLLVLEGDAPLPTAAFRVMREGEFRPVPNLDHMVLWEAVVVSTARWLDIDPLQAYHNSFAGLAAVLWVATSMVLLNALRVRRRAIIPCLSLGLLLLLLDGDLHRSFGNMGLLRIWQGKVFAWSVLLPLQLYFALRCLSWPTLYRGVLLVAAFVVGVSINRSMLFMSPVLLASTLLGYAFAFGWRRPLRGAVVALAVPVLAALSVGGWVLIHAGPAIDSTRLGDGGRWWSCLEEMVLGTPLDWLRMGFLVLIVPAVLLPRPLNRLIPCIAGTTWLLGMSPLTGPLWFELLGCEASWRLFYTVPVPLCLSLLYLGVTSKPIVSRMPRRATVLAFVVLLGLSFDRAALSERNRVSFKWPLELRFDPARLAAAQTLGPALEGHKVVAPSTLAVTLGLTRPHTVDLAFLRPGLNRLTRSTAGEYALSGCNTKPENLDALLHYLRKGASALVISECDENGLARLRAGLAPHVLTSGPVAGGFQILWVEGHLRASQSAVAANEVGSAE